MFSSLSLILLSLTESKIIFDGPPQHDYEGGIRVVPGAIQLDNGTWIEFGIDWSVKTTSHIAFMTDHHIVFLPTKTTPGRLYPLAFKGGPKLSPSVSSVSSSPVSVCNVNVWQTQRSRLLPDEILFMFQAASAMLQYSGIPLLLVPSEPEYFYTEETDPYVLIDDIPSTDLTQVCARMLLDGILYPGNIIGLAYVGKACDDLNTLVVSDMGMGAIILAHEIGHSFNARHVETYEECKTEATIMRSTTHGSESRFSVCTANVIRDYMSDEATCLADGVVYSTSNSLLLLYLSISTFIVYYYLVGRGNTKESVTYNVPLYKGSVF